MLTKTTLFFLPLAPAMVSAGLLPQWLALDRRADICGVNGYDRNRGNYFWSASKKLASYSGCSARCAGSNRCESFGFNDEACMLFDRSLTGNFDEDRHSDVKYFDVKCIQGEASTTSTETTSSSVPRTTTVSSATRTVTHSIALATGTGGPLKSTNGTGSFPVHDTVTANRLPHAPTRASSGQAATPTATRDESAIGSSAAETSDTSKSTGNGGSSGLNTESQTNDGILPPNRNFTLANNDTIIAPNTTIFLNITNAE